MKKYLSGILAIASAIGLSSFTAPKKDMVSFHYIPANGTESYYESSVRWEVRASHFECTGLGYDVCILRIPEDRLYSYSGTQTQQLAAYLSDQGMASLDYQDATEAVEYLTFNTKP